MQVISNGAEAAKGHAVEIWVVSPGKASHPFPATYYLLELCVLEFLSPYEEIEDRHVLSGVAFLLSLPSSVILSRKLSKLS